MRYLCQVLKLHQGRREQPHLHKPFRLEDRCLVVTELEWQIVIFVLLTHKPSWCGISWSRILGLGDWSSWKWQSIGKFDLYVAATRINPKGIKDYGCHVNFLTGFLDLIFHILYLFMALFPLFPTSLSLHWPFKLIARRSLGELVSKLGECVLPLIIPMLSQGLSDPSSSRRQFA
ncbi:uncharacterized protein [Arachis hypogaea]|uniref:uncharacterized protein n=1 Tax=Arachis hypogaea TaxID=3818 RepID=UPI003B213A27